jgi:hypothetical protein
LIVIVRYVVRKLVNTTFDQQRKMTVTSVSLRF